MQLSSSSNCHNNGKKRIKKPQVKISKTKTLNMHLNFGSFHTFHEGKIAELATVSKMKQDEMKKKLTI